MAKADIVRSVRRFFARSGAPLTMAILVLSVVGFLVIWGSSYSSALLNNLGFVPDQWLNYPWTVITHSFAYASPGLLLFCGLSFYFFGTTLENRWGTPKYAVMLLIYSLCTMFATWLAYEMLHVLVPLFGWTLPAACVIVAFAAINPNAQIMLYGVFAVKALWIAVITAAFVVINYGTGNPLVGIVMGLPMLVALAHARGRLHLPMPKQRGHIDREGDYRGQDENRRLQAELERRKLKELFERSMKDDES